MSDETSKTNPIFGEKAQAIIDAHLGAILRELEEAGVKAIGVVAGVMHADETSINWSASDDVQDHHGNKVPAEEISHIIAEDIYASSHPVDAAKDVGQLRTALLGEFITIEKRYGVEFFWEDNFTVARMDGSSFIDQVDCGDGYFSAIGYEEPDGKYYEHKVYGRRSSPDEEKSGAGHAREQ